jgi:non-ribosomal peptide synthetase component F
MQHTPLLMSNILDRGAKVAPDVEIVTATENGTRRQTYAEIRDRAHQLAHALRDAGIGVGDRVATFMWNGSRHLEAYHAIGGMGAVLHTLNIRLSAKDLEYIINHAEDRVIIADADVLPLLEPLKGRIPSVERIVVATEDGFEGWSTEVAEAVDYEEFIAGKPTRFDWPRIDENSALGLCYTSGTTGNPRHGLGHALVVPHAGLQAGHAAPVHGYVEAAGSAGVRGRDHVSRRADHLAGHQSAGRGRPGALRPFPPGSHGLRRLRAAAVADPLVLGHPRGRDDSGMGHDRDVAAGHAVAAGDEAFPPRAQRG